MNFFQQPFWHRPAMVVVCSTHSLKLGENVVQKELPKGIYNYETAGSGIQIIIELISGLFDSVHNLSIGGYSYQSDDV